MRLSRNRLINAARRSMIQRAELHRKLGVARDALKPKALLDRGKYRVGVKIDDTAHAAREQFRNNRLPIALAAVAGVAWLLREPIKENAPKLAQKVQDLANAAIDKFRPGEDIDVDENITEDQNETAE